MANELVKNLVLNTGLPLEPVEKELFSLFAKHGVSEESLTLEQLREIMADYLQTVLLEAKEDLSA